MTTNSRFNRVLMNQYREVRKHQTNNIKFMMSSVPSVWYVCISNISGLDNEYVTGEYVVRMTIPENYPACAPKFAFITANGVYLVDTPICMDSYRGSDIVGFVNIIISQMINWRDLTPSVGTAIVVTTREQKLQHALESADSNLRIIVDGTPLKFT